jgi:Arc/MetJ-type ribon-helix-helix transcriptional regulator
MYVVSVTAKTRVSATVDTDVLEAVQAAVAAGEAESISAYVNDALRLKAEHDRRLRGMDDFIAAHEAEHGEITEEDMEAAYRRAKARAAEVHLGLMVGCPAGHGHPPAVRLATEPALPAPAAERQRVP